MNVHVDIGRGSFECPRLSTWGGEGVKNGQNLVHVVIERPQVPIYYIIGSWWFWSKQHCSSTSRCGGGRGGGRGGGVITNHGIVRRGSDAAVSLSEEAETAGGRWSSFTIHAVLSCQACNTTVYIYLPHAAHCCHFCSNHTSEQAQASTN